MPTTTEKVQELLTGRLSEVRDEQKKIERALEALANGTPRPYASTRSAPRRRGRPRKGKGGRREEAVALIEERPAGITAQGIAKKMGIKPNYLYRLLNELVEAKRVKKDGRTYYPMG